MSEEWRAIRDARNGRFPIEISMLWLTSLLHHLDPGDCTTRGTDNPSNLISLMRAKFPEMKECDAPESNNTLAGTELTISVPIKTSGDSLASWVLTWFTLTVLTPDFLLVKGLGG